MCVSIPVYYVKIYMPYCMKIMTYCVCKAMAKIMSIKTIELMAKKFKLITKKSQIS